MGAPRYFRGSGLVFRSDIELPEFAPHPEAAPDIVIEVDSRAANAALEALPQTWEFGGFQASPAGPVLCVPDVGDFLVTGGTHIAVSPAPGADIGFLRLYVVGSALGMLFHQRGQLILHGASVAHRGRITLFTGQSGAGKSTLAAHLGTRGFPVLSDDTLVLDQSDSKEFVAWPGSRLFKLWEDSLAHLPTPSETARIGNTQSKHLVRTAEPAADLPLPLVEVILLDRTEGPPHLHALSGLEAVALIARNTYRPECLRYTGGEAKHFEQCAALSTRITAQRLSRPWDQARIPETLDLLEAHWRQMDST